MFYDDSCRGSGHSGSWVRIRSTPLIVGRVIGQNKGGHQLAKKVGNPPLVYKSGTSYDQIDQVCPNVTRNNNGIRCNKLDKIGIMVDHKDQNVTS
jgi:hypothetical protein